MHLLIPACIPLVALPARGDVCNNELIEQRIVDKGPMRSINTVGHQTNYLARRSMRLIAISTLLLVFGNVDRILAAPVQWSGNGHYYEYVPTRLNWAAAMAAADSMTYLGLPGYLATVTSAGENAFISSLLVNADWGAWLAGSDAAVEGSWYWVDGPEKGVQFWQGGGNGGPVGGAYSGFSPGEPDNLNNEDALGIWGPNGAAGPTAWGTWNDFQGDSGTQGFVVEYSAVPETSSFILAALGGLALLAYRRHIGCAMASV